MFEVNSTHLLIQTVKVVVAARPKGRDIADIVADLRFLRFDDEGVLSLLNAIVDGANTNTDELGKRLADFNDREWQVADTAARLMERCKRVSNLTHEELQLIAWRKPRVREDIQKAINEWGQPKATIDKDRLRQIRDGILDLNRAIDEAEDKLLHGQRK